MENVPQRRRQDSRVPITITLDPATYEFVESCGKWREFRSVDDLFEAALTIYRRHLEALSAYVELQEARGMTLDDVKRMTQYEIVFIRDRE